MNNNHFIPSVNFHLWEPCNMRCKFCFAGFKDVKNSILPRGHLPREHALQVVKQLAHFGFRKITFAGGEPTLCPWLIDLIKLAKEHGMTTMIVTNGSILTEEFLRMNRNYLDWIALSVDSLNNEVNLKLGRAILGKHVLSMDIYKSLTDKIKSFEYGLKINTVVNRLNYNESMEEFIRHATPIRWKVFQVLPMVGQNDNCIDSFTITENQFQHFVNRHLGIQKFTYLIPETNSQIKGSYVMIDPAGRFFDNSTGTHIYSKPILEVGIEKAIQNMNYDFLKFLSRGGLYTWQRN